MKKNLISVLVPVYNVERYISECIESIINQTYKNLQIILVDDGSTDKSGIICDEYARKDTRINVIHQKNGGLVAARKTGLRKAEGEFVGFVDGDDYIEPDMYEKLVKEMLRKDADMVHTGYFENKKEKISFLDADIDLCKDREVFVRKVISSDGITPSIWSKLFKLELIKKCYFMVEDNASYGEDLICLCAVALNANKICMYADAFYHYRIREDSISHHKDVYNVKKELILYNCIHDILKQENCLKKYDKDMDAFLLQHVVMGLERSMDDDFIVEKYHFFDVSKVQGKKIIVYGAGCVGKDYYSQFSRYTDCEVVVWVDSHPEKYRYPYIKVFGKDCLLEKEYDVIVVAVKKEEVYLDIKKSLLEMGISEEKIMWNIPNIKFQ